MTLRISALIDRLHYRALMARYLRGLRWRRG